VPNIGIWEILLVLLVALLVFGPKRLPEMGRSLGRGMREFKDSVSGEGNDDDDKEKDDDEEKETPASGAPPVVAAASPESVTGTASGSTHPSDELAPAAAGATAQPDEPVSAGRNEPA
jgi:sec-independent protein translocase protein TatA